jgi:hypothetical protein
VILARYARYITFFKNLPWLDVETNGKYLSVYQINTISSYLNIVKLGAKIAGVTMVLKNRFSIFLLKLKKIGAMKNNGLRVF